MASLFCSPLTPITIHRDQLHPITSLPSSHPPLRTKPRLSTSSSPSVRKWRAGISFFPSFLKKRGKSNEEIKNELFEAIAPLDRGAEATPEEQQLIEQIAGELEAVNKIVAPLKSDLLNGKWELIYTTSRSILQSQRPKLLRPNGKIYQAINADTLRAQNMETWPFFNQRPVTTGFSNGGTECSVTQLSGLNTCARHMRQRAFRWVRSTRPGIWCALKKIAVTGTRSPVRT